MTIAHEPTVSQPNFGLGIRPWLTEGVIHDASSGPASFSSNTRCSSRKFENAAPLHFQPSSSWIMLRASAIPGYHHHRRVKTPVALMLRNGVYSVISENLELHSTTGVVPQSTSSQTTLELDQQTWRRVSAVSLALCTRCHHLSRSRGGRCQMTALNSVGDALQRPRVRRYRICKFGRVASTRTLIAPIGARQARAADPMAHLVPAASRTSVRCNAATLYARRRPRIQQSMQADETEHSVSP